MKTRIYVEVKSTYGTERIYPKCALGKELCLWLKKLTFSQADIEILRKIGIVISYLPQKPSFENSDDESWEHG